MALHGLGEVNLQLLTLNPEIKTLKLSPQTLNPKP